MQNFKKISPTENKNCPKHCERPSSKTKTATNLIITNLQTVRISFSFNLKITNPTTLVDPSFKPAVAPPNRSLPIYTLGKEKSHRDISVWLNRCNLFLTECKALSLSRSIGFLIMKNKLEIMSSLVLKQEKPNIFFNFSLHHSFYYYLFPLIVLYRA